MVPDAGLGKVGGTDSEEGYLVYFLTTIKLNLKSVTEKVPEK